MSKKDKDFERLNKKYGKLTILDLFYQLEAGEKAIKIIKGDLCEYIQHDSWRCDCYQKCHCGLDILTDKLGLERVPLPNLLPTTVLKEGRKPAFK